MWSSSSDNRGLSNSYKSSSSSSSLISTSSSSPSPFSPRLRTMEEVWKDINLSSLHDHCTNYSRDHDHHNHRQAANFGGMILQDFLARPFAHSPSPAATASPIPANPATTTMLNLNFVPDLHFFDNNNLDPLRQNTILHQPTSMIAQVPFEALASVNASGRKRVVTETENNSTGGSRNKRMIKNRESAARSRARKQAYMNELEVEVAHLVEENARLKKQQQQLHLAAAAQVPKKNSLYRSSTAPF
ncbi:protein FD-like [Lycium ferocissimum]|uniref:protein FD-like n=1 Tax=Lycium ferocissimum TaxID=112874 RepID=UPI002816780B|nr:protein FD-like [Lycium ferocissimum]